MFSSQYPFYYWKRLFVDLFELQNSGIATYNISSSFSKFSGQQYMKTFACSKQTIETLEKGVKYVQR